VFFIKNWIEGTPNRGKSLHFTFVTIGKEKPAVFVDLSRAPPPIYFSPSLLR
jgi:hypothetical protein